jgi:DNA-binding MarR family transcriptional regulator
MKNEISTSTASPNKSRLKAAIKRSLRELRVQLSLLNYRVGAHLDLNDVDLDCLDLIALRGPLSPSALARHAGLHPATITGILDRLERSGWVARGRDASDRRAIVVRPLHHRSAELVRLYAGMNASIDQICADYGDAELKVLATFLAQTADAGRTATERLAG